MKGKSAEKSKDAGKSTNTTPASKKKGKPNEF
jgi:hypothetical protein